MKTRSLRAAGVCVLVAASAIVRAEPTAPAADQKTINRPVDLGRDRNLFVIGYAHLDTQWRWAYPQVIREYVGNTLRDNFALFEKYPHYIFNFSGSRRYEMMQEYYPAEYEQLKKYVAAGRWFPAGSSVDEGDAMVPSGESFIRHFLYGNRFFRREFGKASEEFMLPDCFGFPASLPTLLAHAGIKGFSTQKLTWGSSVGIPFKVGVWEGTDGRSVVAALDPGAYTGKVREDLSRSESWLKRIETTGAQSGAFVDYHYFGTGDRGGAPDEESVKWVEQSVLGTGPIRVLAGPSDRMFRELKPDQIAKLPRFKGELLLTEHSAGSITSSAYMKRWNRKNELLADAAERAATTALWLGVPYPAQKLYDAWDLTLGSQMHDMLPGTSIPKAYEFCWNDYTLAANQFTSVLREGAGVVASALDTQGQGVPLVVFNPLAVAREDVVEATVTLPGEASGVSVLTPDGRTTPAQILGRENGGVRLAFVAAMAPVSFAVYEVRPMAAAPTDAGALRVSESALENPRYRVTVAPDGDVASIFDKTAQRELLSGPARLAFLSEKPKQYPAWNMDWTDRQKPPRAYVEGPAKIRIVESGPVRVALEIEREAEGSVFVQTIRLAAGGAGDRVEFANRIDWQTRGSSLKAVFPLTVANPIATYATQVGAVERGNNDPKKYEVPQHQWFDLSTPGKSFGVAVLNDCKYGSDKPDDHTLRLTLLYTPETRNSYQDQGTQDFGRHEILYALAAHAGDWRQGQVPWAGSRLNQPLLAFQSARHAGPLGRSLSLFQVSNPQVTVSAVKKAEDSDEIVLRFQELTGQPARQVVVKSGAGFSAAREIDGQERPIGAADVRDGELVFDLGRFGLRAFAVKLGAPATRVEKPASQALTLVYNEDVATTATDRADGRFDAQGRSYPAERLPARLVSEGVEFDLGPTGHGQANAVAAKGQTLALPAGYDRVYLLAAADGATTGRFLVDGRPIDLTVQDWSGYVGQWDNRLWEGNVPETAFSWPYPFAGLIPGYVHPDQVAWFCSHRHTPTGDDFYQYSYLFKYGIPVPAGAKTLTLPDNPRIRIFAVSAARNTHEDVTAAGAVFDRLADHVPDAPRFAPAGGAFDDATTVAIRHPLYWRAHALRYTTDGSVPTAGSPEYVGSLTLNRTTTLTACEIDAAGHAGPVAKTTIEVNDTTPPRVVSAVASSAQPVLFIQFSEPVERSSAESPANYRLSSGATVTSARLAADGTSVVLGLSQPLMAATLVSIHDVRDTSPAANTRPLDGISVRVIGPTFRRADIDTASPVEIRGPGIPMQKGRTWTMNVFVRPTAPIENRTLIAGFGQIDFKTAGLGRYFGQYADGVHLSVRGSEVESTTPLRVDAWQMLTATYDGDVLRLYVDGREVGTAEASLATDDAVIRLAPLDPWDKERRFKGDLREFALWDVVLPADAIQLLLAAGPGK